MTLVVGEWTKTGREETPATLILTAVLAPSASKGLMLLPESAVRLINKLFLGLIRGP